MLEMLKKRRHYVVLSVLLCLITIFGIVQYKKANELSYMQDLEYNRVFAELTEYVNDLEISLLKGQLVSNPQQMARLSSELYRQASGAKANLALLPIGEVHLEKTSEFLSQVGEYANYISQKLLDGESITKEESQTIKKLTDYAKQMSQGLDEVLVGINEGSISFSDEKRKVSSLMSGKKVAMASHLEVLEEEFHGYPSLIYDGPFSQHLSLKEAIYTDGKPELSQKQIKSKVREFMGDNVNITEKKGKLPTFSVTGNNIVAEYTKEGGILLLLMKDRLPGEEKVSISQAKNIAQEFLRQNGFENMKESYYENREGSIVINYAYNQDEYTVFSDLIKVKVALDNGEIIGFESRGYIMNHIYRNIPDEKITKDDALKKINQGLKTQSVTKAIIPLEDGSEAACYQIKGIVADKHFLVYVNTQTGNIEDMQILLESAQGTLAV